MWWRVFLGVGGCGVWMRWGGGACSRLQSIAAFPVEMASFAEVLRQVDEYNQTRLKLTAEMADNSNLIKTVPPAAALPAQTATAVPFHLRPAVSSPPRAPSSPPLPLLLLPPSLRSTRDCAHPNFRARAELVLHGLVCEAAKGCQINFGCASVRVDSW